MMSVHSLRACVPCLAAFIIGALQLPMLVALRAVLTGKTRMGGLHHEILAAAFWIGMAELIAVALAGLWLWYRANHRSTPDHLHSGHSY